MNKLAHSLAPVGIALLLVACSSVLPSKEKELNSPWQSFEEAEKTFDEVQPGITTEQDLHDLGYSPYTTPNIRIESHLQIGDRFDPSRTGRNVPDVVENCLGQHEQCRAYVIKAGQSNDQRVGNVLLDITNFQQKTHTSAWEYEAIFILEDDLVVYKVWSGTPLIKKKSKETNPLGPIQGFTDKLY